MRQGNPPMECEKQTLRPFKREKGQETRMEGGKKRTANLLHRGASTDGKGNRVRQRKEKSVRGGGKEAVEKRTMLDR